MKMHLSLTKGRNVILKTQNEKLFSTRTVKLSRLLPKKTNNRYTQNRIRWLICPKTGYGIK